LKEPFHANWIIKEADRQSFKSVTLDNHEFQSVDSMAEHFTNSILQVTSKVIHQTLPCSCPVGQIPQCHSI